MARAERMGPPDEKVTVNLGPVDVGKVDLLVSEGLYGSRTDFIRTAVRRQIEEHELILHEAVLRRQFTIGYVQQGRGDLERLRAKGERLRARVVGVYRLSKDVTPELADDVLEQVWVLGSFRAPQAVKERLRRKIVRGVRDAEEP